MRINKLLFLLPSGVRKAFSVVFNGTSTNIACGSEASIDNLADNAFTFEGWFKFDSALSGETYLVDKGAYGQGWQIFWDANTLKAYVFCATTICYSIADLVPDNTWKHVAFCFDDAGTRQGLFWVNGVAAGSIGTGNGAIVVDAANNLTFGAYVGAFKFFKRAIGWIRISNSVRYPTAFTPPSRLVPPTVDANTVRLFKMNEGSGTTIIDYSTNAQNATLTDGTWLKS